MSLQTAQATFGPMLKGTATHRAQKSSTCTRTHVQASARDVLSWAKKCGHDCKALQRNAGPGLSADTKWPLPYRTGGSELLDFLAECWLLGPDAPRGGEAGHPRGERGGQRPEKRERDHKENTLLEKSMKSTSGPNVDVRHHRPKHARA